MLGLALGFSHNSEIVRAAGLTNLRNLDLERATENGVGTEHGFLILTLVLCSPHLTHCTHFFPLVLLPPPPSFFCPAR